MRQWCRLCWLAAPIALLLLLPTRTTKARRPRRSSRRDTAHTNCIIPSPSPTRSTTTLRTCPAAISTPVLIVVVGERRTWHAHSKLVSLPRLLLVLVGLKVLLLLTRLNKSRSLLCPRIDAVNVVLLLHVCRGTIPDPTASLAPSIHPIWITPESWERVLSRRLHWLRLQLVVRVSECATLCVVRCTAALRMKHGRSRSQVRIGM